VDAVLYSSGNGDTNDLEIYYKLCTGEVDGSCFMTGEQAGGVGPVERLTLSRTDATIRTDESAIETSFSYTGQVLHDPNECAGAQVCKYVFSTYNPSPMSQPRQLTMRIDIRTE